MRGEEKAKKASQRIEAKRARVKEAPGLAEKKKTWERSCRSGEAGRQASDAPCPAPPVGTYVPAFLCWCLAEVEVDAEPGSVGWRPLLAWAGRLTCDGPSGFPSPPRDVMFMGTPFALPLARRRDLGLLAQPPRGSTATGSVPPASLDGPFSSETPFPQKTDHPFVNKLGNLELQVQTFQLRRFKRFAWTR